MSGGIAAGGLKDRLAFGFGMQGVAFTVTILAQFLMIPVFLAAWDKAVYADWLVLSAAAGLLSMLDLGCHGHLANALRAAWAVGDTARFQRVLRSGLFVYAVLTVLWCGALAVAVAVLDVRGALGADSLPDAEPVFLLLALSTVLLVPRGLVATVYSARGQFGRELGLGIVLGAGQASAQAVAALAGGTPLHAAAATAAACLLLGWGLLLHDLGRRFPDVLLCPRPPTRAELRLLASRAPFYLLSLGAVNAIVQLPVLVLGRLGPDGAVVAFTVTRVFTGLVRQGAAQLATATGMEMARQHVQGDMAGLERVHAGTARLAAGLSALGGGLCMALGAPFFALWTHGAVPFDHGLAAVFLGAVLVMTPSLGALYLLRYIDRPAPVALGLCAQAALGVTLCVLLAPRFGAMGAALAVAAAEVLTLGVQGLSAGRRMTGAAVLPHLAATYATVLLGLALGGGAALALERVLPSGGVAGMAAFTLLWCAVVAVPGFFLLLNAGQRDWLRAAARRLGARAFQVADGD